MSGGAERQCIHLVQGETLSLGVVQAMVVARTRALARLPGMPRFRIVFLEPWRTSRLESVRDAMASHRSLWPEGRIDLVAYVSRLGRAAAAAALAVHMSGSRFRRSKPIFHARGPRATASAHGARRLLGGGRVVLDLRGHGPLESLHRAGFPSEVGADAAALASASASLQSERRAARGADHVLAVTEGLRRHAIEDLGVPEEKADVIPNCVEGTSWSEEARATARARWGNPIGPVLLYSGRVGRERTPDRMFEVLAALLRRDAGSRLVVLSYLDQVGDWEALLSRHGIPREAVILGSEDRDGALALLPGADAGLVFYERAGRYEECTSPIKFAEYLSAGLPVLALDTVGPVVRDVREGMLGWILPAEGGESAVAEAAEGILRSFRSEREVRRDRSLDWCRDRYTWESHLPALRRAYGVDN